MDCDEVTDDIDTQFLNTFAALNTNEHEDLIHKFQGLANDLNYNTGKFFLEMNSWNLQAAIGCYYDFLSSSAQNGNTPMASMKIIRELTIGSGESVSKNSSFKQSWLLENNGEVQWPEGCYLKLVSELNDDGKMPVHAIGPRENTVIEVNLIAPPECGQFRTQFSLCSPNGTPFGPIIWSVVDVSDGGTLSLTQQLSLLETSSGSASGTDQMNFTPSNSSNALALVPSYSQQNPFGSNAAPTVQNNPNLQNPQNRVDDGEMESDDRVLL